jgi:hypothetical protein
VSVVRRIEEGEFSVVEREREEEVLGTEGGVIVEGSV